MLFSKPWGVIDQSSITGGRELENGKGDGESQV